MISVLFENVRYFLSPKNGGGGGGGRRGGGGGGGGDHTKPLRVGLHELPITETFVNSRSIISQDGVSA